MMRSLWTAASGMKGQQTAVDTIANNLANVNTNGYKTQNTQFKSLLYQTNVVFIVFTHYCIFIVKLCFYFIV